MSANFDVSNIDLLIFASVIPGSFLIVFYIFKFTLAGDREAVQDIRCIRFKKLKGKVPQWIIGTWYLSMIAIGFLMAKLTVLAILAGELTFWDLIPRARQ